MDESSVVGPVKTQSMSAAKAVHFGVLTLVRSSGSRTRHLCVPGGYVTVCGRVTDGGNPKVTQATCQGCLTFWHVDHGEVKTDILADYLRKLAGVQSAFPGSEWE